MTAGPTNYYTTNIKSISFENDKELKINNRNQVMSRKRMILSILTKIIPCDVH